MPRDVNSRIEYLLDSVSRRRIDKEDYERYDERRDEDLE